MCFAVDRETLENVGEVDSGHLCALTEKCGMLVFPLMSANDGSMQTINVCICVYSIVCFSERALCLDLLSMPVS